MINNCPCCNKYPDVKVDVKCDNKKCPEFGKVHFVYDWQKLTSSFDKTKFDEIFVKG